MLGGIMQFHKYLDIVYLNKNLEIQKEFSLKGQAETRAIPDLIDWQRSFYKLVAYFTLVVGYLKASATKNYPVLAPELQKLMDERSNKEKKETKLEVVKDAEETATAVPAT